MSDRWGLSWLKGERTQILRSYFSELPIFTVHFVIAVYLETRHFKSLTTGKRWICKLLRKQKWKLKVVSERGVSLAWIQVPVYTCWPNQNTWWRSNSSGATNRRPAGRMRPGGRLLRTADIREWHYSCDMSTVTLRNSHYETYWQRRDSMNFWSHFGA